MSHLHPVSAAFRLTLMNHIRYQIVFVLLLGLGLIIRRSFQVLAPDIVGEIEISDGKVYDGGVLLYEEFVLAEPLDVDD